MLIPRPETEHVVEAALSLPRGARVVDVGTGSGAIALALKDERPDLTVFATDVSADALDVARANALENNVTIYHTINGRRTEAKRTSMKVPANQWQTLRVDVQGNHFTVSLNGQKALDWNDDTFKDAGKVGLWTKADSVTLFDDFTYGSQ